MGAMLGIPAAEIGGKCWRIGGATELRAMLGDGSQQLIKERGRWASDVAQVYQRASLEMQLEMSAAMMGAAGRRDMEDVHGVGSSRPPCRGWYFGHQAQAPR